MVKHSISIKDTNISNGDTVGNQIEQTVSVDDNILPSPQELAEYQQINPKIVDFLIKASEREQQHRHKQDEKKLKIISYNEHKVGRMNWWGMFQKSYENTLLQGRIATATCFLIWMKCFMAHHFLIQTQTEMVSLIMLS